MSVAYYIIPEREIEGFDPFVNGKALGHADEKALANLCQQLNVVPLTNFLSEDPDELEEFFADEGIEVAETPPAVE